MTVSILLFSDYSPGDVWTWVTVLQKNSQCSFLASLKHNIHHVSFFFLPPLPMPPHVLMNFRGFPPGCGVSVADF